MPDPDSRGSPRLRRDPRLLVLVALAGCPARPAPSERPAPPPVVLAPDAAPAPAPPSLLAIRASGGAAELVLVAPDGETRVVHTFRRRAGIADVKDLAVDASTGRYAILVEADTVDGSSTGAPANVMSLVLGTLDGGAIAIGPADKSCVMHRCFESQVVLAGDAVVTTQLRSKATDLARYPFAAAPRPTRLEPRGVERPAFSADLSHLAYQRGNSIYVAPLGSAAASPLTNQPDVAALALAGPHVVVRTRSGALSHVTIDTGASTSLAHLPAESRPIVRIAGTDVITTDGTSVVAIPLDGGASRTLATGALIDVSADGLWALVSDSGTLSIVPTSGGDPIARHEVAAPFGNVRARLR